jgi:glycosyltransferase involved in cell wall biosynthesis
MATYNGEKYIKEQVTSILRQLSDNDELVVSDDNSIDRTIDILNEFNDNRIKIYHFLRAKDKLTPHILAASNFENALRHVQGDYIFLSDQDDIWAPNKVNRFLENIESYDLIMSDCCYIIDNEIKYDTSFCKGKSPIHNYLIKFPSYHGCCIAFRKSLLNVALPFPKKLSLHDGWLGLLAESIGKVGFINEKLTYYRVHNNNVSVGKRKNSILYMISYRLYIYRHLFTRIINCRTKNKK